MVQYTTTSGQIHVVDSKNGSFIIVLDKFVGTITPDSDTKQLKIQLYNENTITNDIALENYNYIDRILTYGSGSLSCQSLKASLVEFVTPIKCTKIECDILKFGGPSVEAIGSGDCFITAADHAYLFDTYLKCSGYGTCVKTQQVIIDNLAAEISCTSKVFDTPNELIIKNCEVTQDDGTTFNSTAYVVGDDGLPESFMYDLQKNQRDEVVRIVDRRKFMPYAPAYTPLTPEDWYGEHIGYTDVDLHRKINQTGEIVDGEVHSREYLIGISSLYSNRMTEKWYRLEESTEIEIP